MSIDITGASKSKKAQERKRKVHHMPDADKRKKVKMEMIPEGLDLTEQDMGNLDRWKNLQRSTKPFVHPVRKLTRNGGEAASNEQQFREQAEQIEGLKMHLANQHQIIQDQKEQIKLLQELQAILVRECQISGMKIPKMVLTEISKQTVINASAVPSLQNPPNSRTQVIPSSSQPMCIPRPLVSPTLPSHAQVISRHPPSVSPGQALSPPMPRQMIPNISPTSRTPPPPQSRVPPTHQAHTKHLLPYPMHPVSSQCNLNPPQNVVMSTVPAYPMPMGRPPPPGPGHFVPQQSQMRMPPALVDQHGVHVEPSQPPLLVPPRPPLMMTGPIRTSSSSLVGDLTFSPLTSSELKELESQNLASTYDPFPDDLDNILDIAGLPTGSGAGYGVGVVEEEEISRSPLHIDLR